MKNFDIEILENPISWDKIEIRKYPLHKIKFTEKKEIVAFDTETLYGYCRLLADSFGNYLLDAKIENILAMLTSKKYEDTHNFFYNLNYDVNAIIKFLPRENLVQLKNDMSTIYNDLDLFYIPKKVFKIKKGHHTFSYFDIAQFYSMSLDKASKKFLGKNKYEGNFIDINGETLGTSRRYWYDNMETIIEYCLNDCKLTKELGELLQHKIFSSVGIYPKWYISKASITKDYVRKTVDIPVIQEIPTKAMQYAFNTYSGGRFEIIEKGNVGKCSLYDIVSAYPYHIRNLIDVTQGKWKKVSSLNENAHYGFYLVSLFTKYNKISPISYYLKNGTLTYPLIQCTKYLTKEELLHYEKYLDYEIINGWEFYPNKLIYPFREYIDKLFSLKKQTDKSNYEYDLYKIFMNSLYGIFYEKIEKKELDVVKFKQMDKETRLALTEYPTIKKYYTGKLFNPIYATLITANTRIQLFELAMQDINNFVGFATDSVLFKGNPDFATSKELGKWELEKQGKSIVIKSGIYQIDNKIQSRGLKKTENLHTEYGDFKNIIDYIEQKPELLNYPVILKNPLSFKKALQCHKKFSIEDINLFIPEIYNIDINKDFKRLWCDTFNCGIELLNHSIKSKPVMLC